VLGIETSCDETAVAIVRNARDVLSSVVHSQVALHAPYGGVVPEVAGRSHLDRILPFYRSALAKAGLTADQLDAIAVTHRPGLIGCLLVGLSVAKTLALTLELPLIGVDHIQAHVDAAFLAEPESELPLLALVASGGHTSLYLVRERGHAERLGATRDDAAGEALDKAAAMLGLGYPGGPALERAAANGNRSAVTFKRVLLAPDSLDFSFSGVKTALLYHLRGPGCVRPLPDLDKAARADLAASFQEAVMDTLVRKLALAAARTDARTVAIGGGVARNTRLRELLADDATLKGRHLVFPPLDLCSDNAAMIAGLGGYLLAQGKRDPLALEAVAKGI
jgi:N6-L-threonylcarbamoyladenine synthase